MITSYQLFIGSSSVLIEGRQIKVFLRRAQADSLSIALNSVLVFSCFKKFVSSVLGRLSSIKRALKKKVIDQFKWEKLHCSQTMHLRAQLQRYKKRAEWLSCRPDFWKSPPFYFLRKKKIFSFASVQESRQLFIIKQLNNAVTSLRKAWQVLI